ncbi:sensor histidine kinase [Streptomyces sp. NPDC058464]|uniref:sensor histidine kinase n=1 Tax=Streptomyces sp. NPDC058464 TaxID=3346511 RepID=UPI00365B9225
MPYRLLRFALRVSLRSRLLLLTVILLAVGLLASTVVVNHLLRGYLQGRADSQLRPAATLFAHIPPTLTPSSHPALSRAAAARLSALNLFDMPVVVYLDAQGRRVGTLDLGADPDSGPRLTALDRTAVAAHGTRPFTVPGQGDDGPRWRVTVRPLADTAPLLARTSEQQVASVAVATSMGRADATVDQLWTISLSVTAALLAALAVVGWFAVRSGFRPLTRIEETATAIAAGDLSHRVPDLADPRTEVGRLATVINEMLGQIETAFAARHRSEARMRRFVADASHELRTPLVGIKGSTDLHRMGALSAPGDIDRTMTRIAGEAERLARLVEDLLKLARLDEAEATAGAGTANPTGIALQLAPTDLRTLAVDALHDVRALDPTRPVDLTGPDGGTPATAAALADEAALRQVVSNLVGNAITHTPAGSPIRIGVGTADGHAVLEVADQGPGLTDEQAERAFERFYRADSSRSRTSGAGAGLGLSIVQSLVTAHHGRVELTTGPGRGATFRVLLPPVTDTHPT